MRGLKELSTPQVKYPLLLFISLSLPLFWHSTVQGRRKIIEKKNMIVLKAIIQTSFTSLKHTSFNTPRLSTTNTKHSTNLFLCKSNESDSDPSPPEGDTRKQELLARIVQLQAQKVRLTDFLDERSEYLTQFAEEANSEFDKIGDDALKGLDEASDRILENINSRMQAFEESAELNKVEIEQNENKLLEFEDQIEKDRNEGLFFKNLRSRTPEEKVKVKEETAKIKELTKVNAGSKTRRNIYLALICLLTIGIANSFISYSPDWRKVAVLGAILVGLISQYVYEQSLLSETRKTKNGEAEEEEK